MRAFLASYLRANYVVPAALVASTFGIVAIAGIMQNSATSSTDQDTATVVSATTTEASLRIDEIQISETVPAAALRAYQEAASIVTTATSAQASCAIDWPLLAGLGAVVSDHGRDEGRLEAAGGEPTGPFQFTTSTWEVYGADGDGDGIRDIDDLDDAALAAALFLCSTGKDLGTQAGTQAALEAFNRDGDFVALVLTATEGYRESDETVPVRTQPDTDLAVICRDEIGAATLDPEELDEMVLLCTETFAGSDIIEARTEIATLVATLES